MRARPGGFFGPEYRTWPRGQSGQLIGMIDPDSGNDLYYLFDRLGSVAATIDPTGTIDTTYDYEPYGEQINADPADTNPYRYAGGYHDTDTGLIKFGTRYYMPDLARWTQPDPVLGSFSEPFSLDPYQYVRGDPANSVDPSGRISAGVLDGVSLGAAIGAVALGTASLATGGAALGVAATAASIVSTGAGAAAEAQRGCTKGVSAELAIGAASAGVGKAFSLAAEGGLRGAAAIGQGATDSVVTGATHAGSYC